MWGFIGFLFIQCCYASFDPLISSLVSQLLRPRVYSRPLVMPSIEGSVGAASSVELNALVASVDFVLADIRENKNISKSIKDRLMSSLATVRARMAACVPDRVVPQFVLSNLLRPLAETTRITPLGMAFLGLQKICVDLSSIVARNLLMGVAMLEHWCYDHYDELRLKEVFAGYAGYFSGPREAIVEPAIPPVYVVSRLGRVCVRITKIRELFLLTAKSGGDAGLAMIKALHKADRHMPSIEEELQAVFRDERLGLSLAEADETLILAEGLAKTCKEQASVTKA